MSKDELLKKATQFIQNKDADEGPGWSECTEELAKVLVEFQESLLKE